jgi:hypothetical protein
MPPTLADRLVHTLAAIATIQNALANKQPDDITDDLMLRLVRHPAICPATLPA